MTITVAIPDTSVSDCPDLRQKTEKIGQIARALSVFKVDRVVIYKAKHSNGKSWRDSVLVEKLLRYMDTPQYLRRKVFPMSPSLKYAGILPPLRIRSHPLETRTRLVTDGELRWGVQERPGVIDIGLDDMIEYEKEVGTRVPTLFRVVKVSGGIRLEPAAREGTEYYFGYETETAGDLVTYLNACKPHICIAFSRLGILFQRVAEQIDAMLGSTQKIVALFGDPYSGVRDLVEDKDALKEHIDFWVNTIGGQGTETVRLEEAIWISLGILNNSFGPKVTKPGFHE
jgi:predicted SPOUT superfamily RNA methylase MTH1